MTTNHVDRLDPALIRPGRADVKLSIGNATADQARRLFERFFPEQFDLSRLFGSLIEDRQHSMAALQDYLMMHRSDPKGAVQGAKDIRSFAGGGSASNFKSRPMLARPEPIHSTAVPQFAAR